MLSSEPQPLLPLHSNPFLSPAKLRPSLLQHYFPGTLLEPCQALFQAPSYSPTSLCSTLSQSFSQLLLSHISSSLPLCFKHFSKPLPELHPTLISKLFTMLVFKPFPMPYRTLPSPFNGSQNTEENNIPAASPASVWHTVPATPHKHPQNTIQSTAIYVTINRNLPRIYNNLLVRIALKRRKLNSFNPPITSLYAIHTIQESKQNPRLFNGQALTPLRNHTSHPLIQTTRLRI